MRDLEVPSFNGDDPDDRSYGFTGQAYAVAILIDLSLGLPERYWDYDPKYLAPLFRNLAAHPNR